MLRPPHHDQINGRMGTFFFQLIIHVDRGLRSSYALFELVQATMFSAVICVCCICGHGSKEQRALTKKQHIKA